MNKFTLYYSTFKKITNSFKFHSMARHWDVSNKNWSVFLRRFGKYFIIFPTKLCICLLIYSFLWFLRFSFIFWRTQSKITSSLWLLCIQMSSISECLKSRLTTKKWKILKWRKKAQTLLMCQYCIHFREQNCIIHSVQ